MIRIYLIDPDPALPEVLPTLLGDAFKIVGSAPDLPTGLAALDDATPDIVLIEYDLPDSLAACQQLALDMMSRGVVFISQNTGGDRMRQAMLAGARNFLQKPLEALSLQAALLTVYDNVQAFRLSGTLNLSQAALDDIQDALDDAAKPAAPAKPVVIEDESEPSRPLPSWVGNLEGFKERAETYLDAMEDSEADDMPPPAPAAPAPQADREYDPESTELTPPHERPDYKAGEKARKREASQHEYTRPVYSAFYPSKVKAGAPYAMLVYVHIESALAEVEKAANGFAGMMGNAQHRSSSDSVVSVDSGTVLTFVVQIEGISLSQPEQSVVWMAGHDGQDYQSVSFMFKIPKDRGEPLKGRVLVFNGALIVGEIPLHMQLVAADDSQKLDQQAAYAKLEPIFASYSRRDTPVMEYFRRLNQEQGHKMLVDVYDIRSGEKWAQRLLDMINDSAVFQLFWSDHSASSEYCQQEWQHALKVMKAGGRERFVQPVYWAQPMPPPPPELAEFHFTKITLPQSTRVQLFLNRLKNWFGG